MFDVNKIGNIYLLFLKRRLCTMARYFKRGFISDPFDEELAYYRQHSVSATSNKWKHVLGHWNF